MLSFHDTSTIAAVYFAVSPSHIAPLQRIQNTAARLVTRTKKSEHITPVLQSLNWLPIHQRIWASRSFFLFIKSITSLPLFTFKILSPSAPHQLLHLLDDCALLPPLIFSYVLVPALLLDTAIVPSLQ